MKKKKLPQIIDKRVHISGATVRHFWTQYIKRNVEKCEPYEEAQRIATASISNLRRIGSPC